MSHGFLEKKNIPRRLILLDTFGYQGTVSTSLISKTLPCEFDKFEFYRGSRPPTFFYFRF